MQTYNLVSKQVSQLVTKRFSTSFSSASKLFDQSIRTNIYDIYGLVRVADEIVDTYQGTDCLKLLNELENDVMRAIKTGFSANMIVHSFTLTARQYNITADLIKPFFESMRTDITSKKFTKKQYDDYIYGSAEVIGLMCLKVFSGDNKQYQALTPSARQLGSAFQKVNFLRDIADDYRARGRYYFPNGSFDDFDDSKKDKIIIEIEKEFSQAKIGLDKLPDNSQKAVKLAYAYYLQLLDELKNSSANKLKNTRISVTKAYKVKLLLKVKMGLL